MASKDEEVLLFLSAGVKTERGRRILRRGDALPDDAKSGEAERLRALGALGVPEPVKPPEEVQDEAAVLAESMAQEVREANGEAEEEPVPSEDPAAEAEGSEPDDAKSGEAEISDDDLAGLNAKDAVELAQGDPELAERILGLERAREHPRSSVIDALEG